MYSKQERRLLANREQKWLEGDPYFMVKWNSPLQVFKYADGHPNTQTNHTQTIGLGKFSYSPLREKRTQINQDNLEGL